MKINSVNSHNYNASRAQSFSAVSLFSRLSIDMPTYEYMYNKGKGRLFEAATDIFAERLDKVEAFDRVKLFEIPSNWEPARVAKLKMYGPEELVMLLNGYHECGFWVNATRTVKQVADDLWASYNNLIKR